MASVEEFQASLKELVEAKRLSGTKLSKLTDTAMEKKSLQNDTQLVSALYRTHKSLAPSFKVSSLYVFDALARAAKHQVNKQKLPLNDDLQATGNAATFLSKLAGVVEGLFQDMQNPDIPEGKVSVAIAFLEFLASPWPLYASTRPITCRVRALTPHFECPHFVPPFAL
ncbi:hypothetical protein EST38_g3726 [Candolleomyces aberdarensis]|uniref:CID domain-containing protein n=1 Tax=Candolleomyces aberdarensis TaxID=2316362 RepID=A0A4Q2DSV0_9AGAR|nr:hypothetical protein EST38_g3726 [Candolleomyces aberdarensis]